MGRPLQLVEDIHLQKKRSPVQKLECLAMVAVDLKSVQVRTQNRFSDILSDVVDETDALMEIEC